MLAIIGVIVAIAVPHYQQAQIYARETAAAKAMQTLQAAQILYQSQYGHFASSRRELGPPETGASSAAAAGLISGTLASGTKGGYRYALSGERRRRPF